MYDYYIQFIRRHRRATHESTMLTFLVNVVLLYYEEEKHF